MAADDKTLPYAQYILKGALVDFKGLKLEDINQAVDKDMPAGFNFYWQDGDEFFLTDDELETDVFNFELGCYSR